MSRLINFLLFLSVLVGAFWLFQVKHQSKEEGEKIAALEQKIQDEKDALMLLKAEWSYLNRPQRVQRLADEFSNELGLQAIQPYQIGTIGDVPDRSEDSALPGTVVNDLEKLLDHAHPAAAKTEQGAR
ncbi:cell division protein FtsL [Cohaesibacter haloalkalitolerans]|uniref:cell division protein FtsL n=1 Tax=Cohaesibacter haloalkalitolerans TaxID=1162980 RepID=UPI000E645F46|nr:hypothetical protein [Cohaesibacter haloalkalitolerans]